MGVRHTRPYIRRAAFKVAQSNRDMQQGLFMALLRNRGKGTRLQRILAKRQRNNGFKRYKAANTLKAKQYHAKSSPFFN